MKKTDKQFYTYSIIAFMIFLVVVYFIYQKDKKDKEKKILEANILSGIGETQNDVNVGLTGVKAEYYPTVDADVEALENARTWYNDDEDTIYSVISNKSKSQLLGLSKRLEAKTGKTLNNWLESVLDEGSEIEHAKMIIRNAK